MQPQNYPLGTWPWACQMMVEGKKVRRASWPNTSYSWYFPEDFPIEIDIDVLTATDWEIFDETPTDIKEAITKLELNGYKVSKE